MIIHQLQPHCFTVALLAMLVFMTFNICAYATITLSRQSSRQSVQENMTSPQINPPPPLLVSESDFRMGVSKKYFTDFGTSDLEARGCVDSSGCYNAYLAARVELPSDSPSVQRLFELALQADQICSQTQLHLTDHHGFAEATKQLLATLPSIPWRFVVLEDGTEGGMPHTQGDMVCLPRSFLGFKLGSSHADFAFIKTLIHEKIHVLQRTMPELWATTLVKLGYKMQLRRQDLPDATLQQTRSNPDLDAFIYSRPGLGKCATVDLLQTDPTQLVPVSLSKTKATCVAGSDGQVDEYEHPNEMVAYKLSEMVLQMEMEIELNSIHATTGKQR